jgi:ketosteroid isomerase-like protein
MTPRPAEVLRSQIEMVSDGRWDDLPRLYAEDAVVEHPFALPEPTRLEGRRAVAEHFASARALPLRLRAENVVVHAGAEADVAVAEFDYVLESRTTGAASRVANVIVARVRDGLIVHSRDYHDHARMAAAVTGG